MDPNSSHAHRTGVNGDIQNKQLHAWSSVLFCCETFLRILYTFLRILYTLHIIASFHFLGHFDMIFKTPGEKPVPLLASPFRHESNGLEPQQYPPKDHRNDSMFPPSFHILPPLYQFSTIFQHFSSLHHLPAVKFKATKAEGYRQLLWQLWPCVSPCHLSCALAQSPQQLHTPNTTLIPRPTGQIAEVAYSLLHSAWHGLAAAATQRIFWMLKDFGALGMSIKLKNMCLRLPGF